MPAPRSELIPLFDLANQLLPRLSGRIGAPGHEHLLCGCPRNPQRLGELLDHWRRHHPEAGPHYWSIRCWTLLIWQPIYLSLLAVHLGQRAPCLADMGQEVCEGFVGGLCLPDHCPRSGTESALICFAAEQLHGFIETQLTEFAGVVDFHPKMGRLFAADCATAALLLIQKQQGWSDTRVRQLERHWLEALRLPVRSALLEVPRENGEPFLALGRRVCCQHFRRGDGELCSTCPKLPLETRRERLRLECLGA